MVTLALVLNFCTNCNDMSLSRLCVHLHCVIVYVSVNENLYVGRVTAG